MFSFFKKKGKQRSPFEPDPNIKIKPPKYENDLEQDRVDIKIPNGKAFILYNLLSSEECDHYIERTEKIGYESISNEYPKEYRNNLRITALVPHLADRIYERLMPFMKEEDIRKVTPMGFGMKGIWKPSHINECMKFSKYLKGGFFKPHKDGLYVPHENESSIFSVVIFLNDDFKGGETRFLTRKPEKEDEIISLKDVLATVRPQKGSAIIFNHDLIHEGLPVIEGVKYIIRTEIMFQRKNNSLFVKDRTFLKDAKYIESKALFDKAEELHKSGDAKKYTETYLKALEIQCDHKGVLQDADLNLFVPFDIFTHIFTYLDAKEVRKYFIVCKDWLYALQDGRIWKELYYQIWPEDCKMECKIDPSIQDWYGMFKQKSLASKSFIPLVIEFGDITKYGYKGFNNNKYGEIESFVGVDPYKYCRWYMQTEDDRYCFGGRARRHGRYTEHVFEKGKIKSFKYLPELISESFRRLYKEPEQSCVMIIEHPNQFSHSEIAKITNVIFGRFSCIALGFVPSALCILCYIGEMSGLVIIHRESLSIVPVFNGTVLRDYQRLLQSKPNENELIALVREVISSCPEETRESLAKNIICSNGNEDNLEYFVTFKSLMKGYNVIITNDKYDAIKGGTIYGKMKRFRESCTYRAEFTTNRKMYKFEYH